MKPLIFTLFSEGPLLQAISKKLNIAIDTVQCHEFPDKETYIKINSDVKNRTCLIFESLNHPNNKILPVVFLAETLRDLGAKNIGLIAPYLAYMRQDKRFQPGEGITSSYFAKMLSHYFNWLSTVDPHLHRIHHLNQIYSIPSTVIHATEAISEWIKMNVVNPLLIGPDRESVQWVEQIAIGAGAAYLILEKTRHGDSAVEVSIPEIQQFQACTPVLVDDIISTARTMIETIKHLNDLNMKPPVCIGIHGVFADNAYDALLQTGANQVVTCNTITHVTNKIDLSEVIANQIDSQLKS